MEVCDGRTDFGNSHTMALERWEVKALCMFGLFANQIIFILLPLAVADAVNKKGKKGKLALSILSCFGGGVFFGTYLMHLNPEVRELLEECLLEPYDIDFPIPELCAGFGFFLILFIEMGVKHIQVRNYRREQEENDSTMQGSRSRANSTGVTGNSFRSLKEEEAGGHYKPCPVCTEMLPLERLWALEEDVLCPRCRDRTPLDRFLPHDSPRCSPALNTKNKHAPGHVNLAMDSYENANGKVVANGKQPWSKESEAAAGEVPSAGETPVDEVDHFATKAAFARSIIFIMALSIDSVFEGLSLGLKLSTTAVITMFVAIISHEFVISFCIGMELVKHFSKGKMIGIGVLYSLTPVVGAVIGTAVVETAGYDGNETVDIVNGVLQGVCAGAFIYCAFIGILSDELTQKNGLIKSLTTLAGFAFMAGMAAIPEDEDDEDPDAPVATTRWPEMTTLLWNMTSL